MGAIVSTPDSQPLKSAAGDSNQPQVERRARIFEKSSTTGYMDVGALNPQSVEELDPQTLDLLTNALRDFFFLEKEASDSSRMGLLLGAMQHEVVPRGTMLLTEGEPGNKMYVLESGDVQVTIKNIKIRQMGRGALLGELALLYDAPRSATVRCLTDCSLWSLKREIFKQIQALAASASLLQRSKWVYSVPEISAIGSVEVSKIVRTMQSHIYHDNELLISSGEVTNKCFLVEKGELAIQISNELAALPMKERDKVLGIFRPKGGRRFSTSNMTVDQLKTYVETADDKKTDDEEKSGDPAHYQNYIVHEGCFLGMGPLRGKAGLTEGAWPWTQEVVDGKKISGATCPFTARAVNKDLQCSFFTVDAFERLLGPVGQVLNVPDAPQYDDVKPRNTEDYGYVDITATAEEIHFDASKFRTISILGRGSFGVVTLAEYHDGNSVKEYACKALSKAVVIETGQLRHVVDERRLLQIMISPFIIRLFGTFQTEHQLILVQESLNCGDLWAVLYETPAFLKAGGLPPKLIRFYSVCIVLALAHIHGKGVAYRDLKPENIMLDSQGYIRIIDFGFAKRIPFNKVEANGETKMHLKSYTLCGTPEYLSPEFIFNAGHDNSADLWAFGVMVYEMYMGVTPFAPRQAGNMTDLFTRIATVKRCGLILPNAIDVKDEGPTARYLIEQLLKAEPSERIGVQEGDTGAILDHDFFEHVDIPTMRSRHYVPSFAPAPIPGDTNLNNLVAPKPFTGDQNVFEGF
mmetsp:Transcript_18774/g.18884  ORF Transcript_18774/g.18884 Transcript_18774/m.18884 type:complete len:749 (-) Transcript_18774:401-2647(-)|eukprot:CAMPEP_0182418340 /NCGR_PEP_ID=MMETSP1167-20130531/2798_1 /TAXON_ID=2988 /ORGANISM="Mallomonas Sp, Strain CCMP3275" /LENGTH=748 /DNA_ID=CAMNT_0024592503 /DNA_START=115 /DNA_END=2361 /DNA_ORIENTATION=-